MPDDYSDIIAAALGDETPRRTRKGALKYQPTDTDWSLDRLGELQDFYQSTYKRPLPIAVKGQGSVHNRMGYDHRSSADISLNPTTAEGQALITELQRRRVPFIAFDRAIPGSSTGPHIHLGRPSSRTTARYGIGQQVKGGQRKAAPADYSDVVAAALGQEAKPAKPATPPLEPELHQLGQLNDARRPSIADLRRADDTRQVEGIGELKRRDEAATRVVRPTSIGQLRQLDETAGAERRAVEAEVRQDRENPMPTHPDFARGLKYGFTSPIAAVRDVLAGRDEEASITREINQRLEASAIERERLAEITSQFTDEDRANLSRAVERMRGMGPVNRGIEIGSQRMGSGLLYKLAGIADILDTASGGFIAGREVRPSWIGEYLRRQAGRGEMSINEIEAELPPEASQQIADFLTHAVVVLPEIIGATAVAGPVGGFAALGGLEAAGRKQSFGEVAKETAKGALLGGVFKGAAAAEVGGPARTFGQRAADTARSGAAIGLGTAVVEKAFGATDYDAARAAASNVFLHVAMRAPTEIARFTSAAERALKEPDADQPSPTVPFDLQEKLARAEAGRPTDTTPVAKDLTTPPADLTRQPPLTAEPAADVAATTPAAPSRFEGPERRGPDRLSGTEWLELTPEERAIVRRQVDAEEAAKPALGDLMRERAEAGPTEKSFVEQRLDDIHNTFFAKKPPAERPTEAPPAELDDLFHDRGPQGVYVKAREGQFLEKELFDSEAIKRDLDLPADYRVEVMGEPYEYAFVTILNGKGERDYSAENRLVQRLSNRFEEPPTEIDVETARPAERPSTLKQADEFMAERRAEEELANLERRARREAERREIDSMSRQSEELPLEERMDRARQAVRDEFPEFTEAEVDAYARRVFPELFRDIIDLTGRTVDADPSQVVFDRLPFEIRERAPGDFVVIERRSGGKEVEHTGSKSLEEANALIIRLRRLRREGGFIDLTEVIAGINELRAQFPSKSERELRAMLPVRHRELLDQEQPLHPSTAQPRTDTGQFSPGPPGGAEAARSQLRSEARKYREQFGALDRHQARREGLDIVSDDIAHNYFGQLRRLAAEHLPNQVQAVDRAESLYNQGKYGQAGMLAESIFGKLPDKVNEYSGADAAIQLARMGIPSKSDWTKVLQEVRERLKRTGGLSGGGSTFYDVNKYPEGGRPDHSKIAYILEPVVQALKADAARLIAEGKLKAADYVAHIREQANKMLQGPEFTDWHPLNKSAAMGVLVDRLRGEGPPVETAKPAFQQRLEARANDPEYRRQLEEIGLTPDEIRIHLTPRSQLNEVEQAVKREVHQRVMKGRLGELDRSLTDLVESTLTGERPPSEVVPGQRNRSLPPTLERSGRDPGTDLTYDRLPNAEVNARVERRLETEGADALESWYRAAPESADRTAAHRILVDHYTAQAVALADTAPQRAESLMARATELTNIEDARATTIGQAMQMYSNLNRFTPAGVLREITTLAAKGAEVTPEQTSRLVEAAHQHKRADKDVKRLERKLVEAEAKEAPEPTETATPPPRTAAGRRAQRRQGTEPSTPEPREGAPRRYRPRTGAPDTPAERIRRQLDEAAQRRRAHQAFIAAQLRALAQQRTVTGYWKRSMNITRGLMVSAFSTAMRNLQSQLLRFDIERLDDAVEHTIRRSIGLDSDLTYRNILRNTARQFQRGQQAEAAEILRGHEAEYWRMFNTYAGGVEMTIPGPTRARVERVFQTVERGVEIANYFNRVQEFHVRSAEFLAELDLHLRREHNQTLEQFVRRNGIDAIPQEVIRRGVDKALEVTFADMPARDGAGGRLIGSMIEMGNYIPPTISPVAFPRFMFNNIKFLYQHSPAGMLDLARRGQNRPRIIARSLVGTSMLLLAYQFRQSDHAGEKWYELRFGDTTLDARPFGPFSTYLFLAEGIRRAKNGEKQFTLDEVAQALGASVLGSGTGLALAEKVYKQLSDGDWEKLQRTLKTEGGEWGRALLTPVRQVKDLIAAFDESQAINRDTSQSPFLGPMQESIPYAEGDLPPAHVPTTEAPLRQERPATKAITGWRVQTPKTFLQAQLDELNFTSQEILPSTGDPAIDALQKRLMGPLMDQLSAELENDAEFRSMTRKARAAYLRDLLSDIREEVREAAEEEAPDLIEQNREERKPRRQREYEQELNSPGLSRALDLGVPMPIPPMQPGEDDIAYRARLLQTGRARRARLDSVVGNLGSLNRAGQRSLLHEALYRG